MKLSKEQFEEMLARYQREETTAAALAEEYGITSQSLLKSLRRRGIRVRDARSAKRVGPAERLRMVELYEGGASTREIAAALSRANQTVCNCLRREGIELRSRAETRLGRVSDTKRNAIETLYKSGQSLEEVAEALDLTVQIVRAELQRRDVERRSVGRKTRFADDAETAAQIFKGYANGCSVSLLAEVYKCSRDAIKQVLLEADVTLRKEGPGKRVYQFVDRKGREHWMRSSWEIKTAIYLDQKGTEWDYEKETYEIGQRKRYTPDFWLYAEDGQVVLIIDVKGWLYPKSDDRIKLFQEAHPDLPFELWGQKELTEFGILDLEIPEPPKGRKRKGLRSRISKAEIAEAVRLYESGMTTGQVAEALNRSESAIARQLQKLGKTRNRHQTKKMMGADQGTRDLIAQTYLSGLSMTKTAEKLGLSRDIVAREIKVRGLSRSRSRAQLLKNR